MIKWRFKVVLRCLVEDDKEDCVVLVVVVVVIVIVVVVVVVNSRRPNQEWPTSQNPRYANAESEKDE